MTADRETLREQYLAAIEHEITDGRSRLNEARRHGRNASKRGRALAAISDVTLDWLEAERDRVRAGEAFDEEAARRFLGKAG
jgi:hypothetical protein